APYQLQQSLATMGAGGILGTGLGKGWQKLSYLPEANTDFVFAVIGEELGLVGTLSIILLWVGVYWFGWRMLRNGTKSTFGYAAGFTLLTQFLLQALMNMAVVTALVPPKGIAHPLISRGGSNLIINLMAIGILISLSRERREEAEPSRLAGERRKPEYRTDPGLCAG
ncbi:MAG: FtsW/RodA/SpoVE family cell cycle protein, partial [Planctomycetaceae bacterium]|nr:FtsW/RodA/SpoVE family cell cycle protein [Planctomycetaceae bacterium]